MSRFQIGSGSRLGTAATIKGRSDLILHFVFGYNKDNSTMHSYVRKTRFLRFL